jgi:hypothetical protein
MARGTDTVSAVRGEREHRHATAADDVAGDDFSRLLGRVVTGGGIITGVVQEISADGVARVLLAGEVTVRDAASLKQFASAREAADALLGRTVLVVWGAPDQLVILGAVSERVWKTKGPEAPQEVQAKLPASEPVSVQADKRHVNLEAAEEIRLTCGQSSLVMRRDGTIVIRGIQITSRALQANKIRGATVNIN